MSTTYRAEFMGKKTGAIGAFQAFTVDVEVDLATDLEDAVRMALYGAGFEHLHAVKFKQVVTPSRPDLIPARCIRCGKTVHKSFDLCNDCGG